MLVVVRASFERDEEEDVLREGERGREGKRRTGSRIGNYLRILRRGSLAPSSIHSSGVPGPSASRPHNLSSQ